MPPMHRGEAIPAREIAAHLLVEHVVVEQAVEFHKHRVGLAGEFGHTGEDILGWITVDKHGGRSCAHLWCGRRAFYHPRLTRLPMIPGLMHSISLRQLVLEAVPKH